MLGIPLDVSLNIGYENSEFLEILLKKNLEFVLTTRSGTIAFNLNLVLLPAEIDFISEKQGCKGDILRVCGTGYVKIVFAL